MESRDHWIKVGLESGFDDEFSASEHLDYILDILDDLPEEVKLYRIVYLDSLFDLDKLKPGTHYVLNKNSLLRNHYLLDITSSHGYGEKPYLLTVKVNKSKIDLNLTVDNNMRYPNEQEIILKNKGKGAVIIDIKEIK